MSDIVQRLRDCANCIGSFKTDTGDFGLCDDAADLIEELLEACQAFVVRFDVGSRADSDYVAGLMRAALAKTTPSPIEGE